MLHLRPQELMPFKATVVSTGGGAVVRRRNWGFMHHAIVVWLTGAPELLARRALRDGAASRPLLAQDGNGAAGSSEVRCRALCPLVKTLSEFAVSACKHLSGCDGKMGKQLHVALKAACVHQIKAGRVHKDGGEAARHPGGAARRVRDSRLARAPGGRGLGPRGLRRGARCGGLPVRKHVHACAHGMTAAPHARLPPTELCCRASAVPCGAATLCALPAVRWVHASA